jgi:tRNA U34 5-carboxymethylaminomethyl modifying GTPase MnmE/TrmE
MTEMGIKWCQQQMVRWSGESYNIKARALGRAQTELFELIWSGTLEQSKKVGTEMSNDGSSQLDMERAKAIEGLDRTLHEYILKNEQPQFSILFCGMVKAGKSTLLNALIGQAVLPSDGT